MIAAAVVPHPPLLVPELAGGAAAELAALLLACDAAVAQLLAPGPQPVICVGGGARSRRHPAAAWGSLGGYGVVHPRPPWADGAATLPLSLTVGRWLLDRAGWSGTTIYQEVDGAAGPAECAGLGQQLATEAGAGAGWLVLGDGCIRREPTAVATVDAEAERLDAAVSRALAGADAAALLALEPPDAHRLGAAGRAAWQVLAGAAARSQRMAGRVSYDAAPCGVGYLVAEWTIPLTGPVGQHA